MTMFNIARNLYADAGHLLFFGEKLSDSFKDDVLGSSLYVQLAASNKHPRFDNFNSWYSLYVEAMPRFGGVPTGENSYRPLVENDPSFTVWGQISNRLEGRVSVDVLDGVSRYLLGQEEAEQITAAILLFRDHAMYTRSDTPDAEASVLETSLSLIFSFVNCDHSVISVFMSFKTTEPVGEKLFSQTFQTEKVIGDVAVEVILSEFREHSYRRVRQRLNSELGERKQKLIIRFERDGHE